jgi:L-threonylcarbamoyladenylate synthase
MEIIHDIDMAASLLKGGQLVGIPTETVYGLAANALDASAVARIFEAKKRPFFDPLIVHIGHQNQLSQFALEIPESAQRLADFFWPGPLTLVLKRSNLIPDIVTAGLDSVGLRCPDHPLTLALLRQLDFPLAAPSANPFGYISPTCAQHVMDQLGNAVGAVLDGGSCAVGVESTIVQCISNEEVILLRQGGVPLENLEDCLGRKLVVQTNSTSNPAAPGMLLSHYAPKARMVRGDIDALLRLHADKKTAYLSFCDQFPGPGICLSPKASLAEAAAHLFGAMRELDRLNFDLIVTEIFPEEALGRAINDRLSRASYLPQT